jgi:N-acetylglucosaminyldiphosphoundecaprenol N-acetyl-beta-D-mannosaminyltransferase
LSGRRVFLLGVPVDLVGHDEVVRWVEGRVGDELPAQIVTINAEFVVRAQRDVAFARVLGAAPLATPDGAGVVWALRRAGFGGVRRVGGSDLVWSISARAAASGWKIFLLGGAPGVAEAAAATLRAAYPGLVVAGAYAGSPREDDEAYIVDLIRAAATDVLFVAFGAPAQDLWIARNQVATGARVAMGVGGSLDYLAGTARRAPGWMQDRELEWLWRLMRQPWRWKRMLALPRFVWLVWTTQDAVRGA